MRRGGTRVPIVCRCSGGCGQLRRSCRRRRRRVAVSAARALQLRALRVLLLQLLLLLLLLLRGRRLGSPVGATSILSAQVAAAAAAAVAAARRPCRVAAGKQRPLRHPCRSKLCVASQAAAGAAGAMPCRAVALAAVLALCVCLCFLLQLCQDGFLWQRQHRRRRRAPEWVAAQLWPPAGGRQVGPAEEVVRWGAQAVPPRQRLSLCNRTHAMVQGRLTGQCAPCTPCPRSRAALQGVLVQQAADEAH